MLYILILIEFQSRVDPVMALRQLVYVASFYEDLHRQKRLTAGGKLPPVLPVVLYNGERKWRSPSSVEDMIEAVPEPLARYQPRMSYFLLDERRTPADISPEERNTVGALLAIEQGRLSEILEPVFYLVDLLREPQHESLRQAFKEFVSQVVPAERVPLADIFDHPEETMTLRERLQRELDREHAVVRAEGRKQGIQEGMAQGIEKGLAKGRAEGQRALLAKQLRLKFGALDAAAEERLTKATHAQLEKWAKRVLTAASLDEVWA